MTSKLDGIDLDQEAELQYHGDPTPVGSSDVIPMVTTKFTKLKTAIDYAMKTVEPKRRLSVIILIDQAPGELSISDIEILYERMRAALR